MRASVVVDEWQLGEQKGKGREGRAGLLANSDGHLLSAADRANDQPSTHQHHRQRVKAQRMGAYRCGNLSKPPASMMLSLSFSSLVHVTPAGIEGSVGGQCCQL